MHLNVMRQLVVPELQRITALVGAVQNGIEESSDERVRITLYSTERNVLAQDFSVLRCSHNEEERSSQHPQAHVRHPNHDDGRRRTVLLGPQRDLEQDDRFLRQGRHGIPGARRQAGSGDSLASLSSRRAARGGDGGRGGCERAGRAGGRRAARHGTDGDRCGCDRRGRAGAQGVWAPIAIAAAAVEGQPPPDPP